MVQTGSRRSWKPRARGLCLPPVDVYLVAAPDSTDSQSVIDAEYITLGALRSAEGDQSYPVPANLDLGVYRSVTVWCVPFELNFTTAPLTAVAGG